MNKHLTILETRWIIKEIRENNFEKAIKMENGDIFIFDKLKKLMVIFKKGNDYKYNLIVEKNGKRVYGHERYPHIIELLPDLEIEDVSDTNLHSGTI